MIKGNEIAEGKSRGVRLEMGYLVIKGFWEGKLG